MLKPIHVVGAGVISCLGNHYDACFSSLQQGEHGLRVLSAFDSIHAGVMPVGQVNLNNEALAATAGISKPVTRTAMLGMVAAKEALQRAGLTDFGTWRVGLLSGTTVGGMDRTEQFFPSYLQDPTGGSNEDIQYHACGATTELIGQTLGITGFTSTINTACSSAVNAIMYGARLIRQGMLDIVVAGGTDALTRFTINGFNSLMILDTALCRPFDTTRKGLNLGEGAGYLVLVSEEVHRAMSLHTLALVSGYSNTNDAYHQTASSPEGRGSYAAMKQTIEMAGLQTKDIDYINLHGTGTVNNDASEGTAIRRLFGDALPPVSSTKSFTGHTLGACGGIEAAFSVMALAHQCVFGSLRCTSPIAELGVAPQSVFASRPVTHVMSNAFGFGGNCSSIVFSKPAGV